jgi:demethylmenaquinone methyltransferase / 2-methoxy-6-polyprenyl-1,4-benzoquinol methylase
MSVTSPITPYNDLNLGKKEQVKKMFNTIAGRYDFMNRLLTMRIDILWRRKAVKLVKSYPHSTILDIATGTGDFAIELASANWQAPEKITGVDIAEKMLEIGRKKVQQKGLSGKIELIEADSENLPFLENTYDLATSAFGVRNFENLSKGLSEIYRVLKPGGSILILEASEPSSMPFKKLYKAYMSRICPAIGGAFSENKAYAYLNKSVAAFPSGKKFEAELLKAGFIDTRFIPLSMGVTSIYIAKKKDVEK